MNFTFVGVDLAKSVFQLHWVDPVTGEIINKQVKRSAFLEQFANREVCVIGMEACGGAHHWARQLLAMGHQVRLMPAKFVRAFRTGNKNDAADARAIWVAMRAGGCKTVAVKTEAQQAILALHRMREQQVKFRTAQMNGLRGLIAEYGEVIGRGRAALDRTMPDILERLAQRLYASTIHSLRDQWNNLKTLDEQIGQLEQRLESFLKEDAACRAIAAIPGVGLLTASAAVATMGDAKTFASGREFAAWLGLVPAQTGTGGRVKLLSISKRGDVYLRTLLIHGARSVLFHAKTPGPWVEQMRQRKPKNVAAVALANKMARTIWAVLAHGKPYQQGYVSVKRA
jgi:transposase